MLPVYDVRFAPSPTGMPTLASARMAYLNYLFARASGGRFVLRLDDTDDNRNVPGAADAVFAMMDYLGLDYDATYQQSARRDRYLAVASMLLRGDFARYQDGAVVLNVPLDMVPTAFDDMVLGTVQVSDQDRQDATSVVLVRSNGLPTYQFASVVDDADDRTSLVLRGVDLLPSTPRQLTVLAALRAAGLDVLTPRYAHVGLLMQSGRKMSKRNNDAAVLDLRDAGYSPAAVLNYVLRMGFSPKVDDRTTALLPLASVLDLLRTGDYNLRASPANVDPAKLDAYDRKYKARGL